MRTLLAFAALFCALAWSGPPLVRAQSQAAAAITEAELKEWLSYLASDELQGRQAYTEGYGLAAQYVAAKLASFGVKPPAGGSYLQPVRVRGYRVTRNSSVTIEGSETRTFKHGDHVTFPANAGGQQDRRFDGVEFVGYAAPEDLKGRDLTGKLVAIVPRSGNPGQQPPGPRGAAGAISLGAAAAITFVAAPAAPSAAEQALTEAQAALAQATAAVAEAQRGLRGRGAAPAGRGNQPAAPPDFTTAQRIDTPSPPQVTADETFFEALFAGSATPFADIRARAQKGEPLAPATLPARVVIDVDHAYEQVSQQTTHNVIGVIEGSDSRLRGRYVLFSAHLDHVGISQTTAGRGRATDACRRRSPAAQAAIVAAGKIVQRPSGRGAAPAAAPAAAAAAAVPFDQRDRISNGADDDGSGSAALLAIAKAFAAGARPKRSIAVVWHTAEESGLQGSRFNADFPGIPLDDVEAVFNMDMIGRDDCDNVEGDYSNTVFVVGADRISTDLHNAIVTANRRMPQPMTLDFELNDPEDPENVYARSDHYSYAQKGIPVAFFTTGLHPDYHRVSDTVDRIRFDKLTRVTRLVYQAGLTVASADTPLVRDNKGARTGFGARAELLPK